MNNPLFDVYVAVPYSHECPAVKEYRFELANKYTAQLYNKGLNAFSPITHSHPLHKYDVRTDFDFYEELDLRILMHCKELHIIIAEGWLTSKGVTAEKAFADNLGIPIKYINENMLIYGEEHTPIGDWGGGA